MLINTVWILGASECGCLGSIILFTIDGKDNKDIQWSLNAINSINGGLNTIGTNSCKSNANVMNDIRKRTLRWFSRAERKECKNIHTFIWQESDWYKNSGTPKENEAPSSESYYYGLLNRFSQAIPE